MYVNSVMMWYICSLKKSPYKKNLCRQNIKVALQDLWKFPSITKKLKDVYNIEKMLAVRNKCLAQFKYIILHKYIHNAILVLKKLYSQKYHVNSYCEFVGFYFKENERMT
jgi:hypothetical protein